jgi:uncharacterized membrane protein HdeD (DUF308 family)
MLTVFLDWRLIMLRAFAALTFGLLTLVWPGLTLWVLVVMFGAYALVDGVFTLVDVARDRPETRRHRGWLIFDGVLGVLTGLITFVWPAITALALLFVIAAWAIITGALRLRAAIEVRDEVPHVWLFGLGGALSILFGILLVITPGPGVLVITWLIGWYAIIIAAMLFVHGWRMRELQQEVRRGETGWGSPVVA